MKRDDFLKQFLGGQGSKARQELEGDVLIEWTNRVPIRLRVLYLLAPVVGLLGYYAFKYLRGAKFAPLDMVITFFLLVFGSRLAGTSRKYSLTTAGVYQFTGANWRKLGEWGQFESCRREEGTIILGKRKGYPRVLKLPCNDREKMMRVLALANEQISRHRWK